MNIGQEHREEDIPFSDVSLKTTLAQLPTGLPKSNDMLYNWDSLNDKYWDKKLLTTENIYANSRSI